MRHAPVAAAASLVLLLAAPAGARHRPVVIRMPAFEVPARSNREVCTFVPLPSKGTFDVGDVTISNLGGTSEFGTHHMILYTYVGALAPLARYEGRDVDDNACFTFAPHDPQNLRIVATSQSIRSRQLMPRGTALELAPQDMNGKPTIGLVLNSHWINGSDRPHRARVKLRLASARHVVKPLKPIFEAVACGFIDVPPGQTADVGWQWGPGLPSFGAFLGGADNPAGAACVTMVISHMHRRGTRFTIDFADGTGGAPEQIYTNTRYSEPPARNFDPPLLVKPGQQLAYRCTHDNATDPRLGCEEQAGVAPGVDAIHALAHLREGAAKLCRTKGDAPDECPPTDPDYPDRTFTGRCVEANLVFGFTSEDEMCILPGYYYDADPAAAPGHECDL